nr:Lrp/AsnC family transcriptional regulator [bacterium]
MLEENAHMPREKMATLLDMEVSEVEQAICEMEKEGIISGYHAAVNWERAENSRVEAMIEVRVSPQRDEGFDIIAERLYRFSEVREVSLVSGGFDLLLRVSGQTMRDVAFFVAEKLATQEGVLSCATHFILKDYKTLGVVLEERSDDDRLAVML